MFNRSAIMKAAWEMWSDFYENRPHIKRELVRSDFAFYLAVAWRNAKAELKTEGERRADAIRAEIAALPYKPLRIDIEPRRRTLETELAAIAA
jgi:hypothetical protein